MVAKTLITKDMILKQGFELIKKDGYEKLTTRGLSKNLGCSTQPILYNFATVEDLKKELYEYIDKFHSRYLMKDSLNENPFLQIGLNYVEFAQNFKNLFVFLFQSNKFSDISLDSLIDTNDLTEIIGEFSKASGMESSQAKQIFSIFFISVHGYASLLANNLMEYNRKDVEEMLGKLFESLIK